MMLLSALNLNMSVKEKDVYSIYKQQNYYI